MRRRAEVAGASPQWLGDRILSWYDLAIEPPETAENRDEIRGDKSASTPARVVR
jgi:hypothetical protein